MAFQDVIHKEDSPWESVPSVYRLRGGLGKPSARLASGVRFDDVYDFESGRV